MSSPMLTPADAPSGNNRRLLMVLTLVVGGMVGLAYASFPLYQLFCQVTGYGGTTQGPPARPAKMDPSSG